MSASRWNPTPCREFITSTCSGYRLGDLWVNIPHNAFMRFPHRGRAGGLHRPVSAPGRSRNYRCLADTWMGFDAASAQRSHDVVSAKSFPMNSTPRLAPAPARRRTSRRFSVAPGWPLPGRSAASIRADRNLPRSRIPRPAPPADGHEVSPPRDAAPMDHHPVSSRFRGRDAFRFGRSVRLVRFAAALSSAISTSAIIDIIAAKPLRRRVLRW